MGGSMKNKIISSEFLAERARCDFDQRLLAKLCAGDAKSQYVREKVIKDCVEDPRLWRSHKYYEMTRKETFEHRMKIYHYLWFHKDREFYFKNSGVVPSLGSPLIAMHHIFIGMLEANCDEE